jgi:hypothetical protein
MAQTYPDLVKFQARFRQQNTRAPGFQIHLLLIIAGWVGAAQALGLTRQSQ